jgi:hypothetical protein
MTSPIRPRDRFDIFQRDGFMCRYCGKVPGETELQIDHMVPLSKGGTNSLLNLITSCRLCNAGKGGRSVERVPAAAEVVIRAFAWSESEDHLRKQTEQVIEVRKQRYQQAINMVCHALNIRSCKKSTGMHVMNLITQHGPDLVDEWVYAAASKVYDQIDDQSQLIRYVYGCARKHRNTEGDR